MLFLETQLSGVDSLELEWPNKLWCKMLTRAQMDFSSGQLQRVGLSKRAAGACVQQSA
jgi:hypothetical protein